MEFDYPEIYAPLDLERRALPAGRRRAQGGCRAATIRRAGAMSAIATKYPEITRRHFAARGVQAECIKLNGAMELAPSLGLCRHIVDLVPTGAHPEGERPGRDRAHRRRQLAPHRQPRRAQDARRRGRRLDRALPRGGRCRLGSTAPSPGFARDFAALARRRSASWRPMSMPPWPRSSTTCRRRGDAALIEYTEPLRPARADARDACASPRPRYRRGQAILRRRHAGRRCASRAERIEAFHRRQLPADIDYTDEAGVRLGARWRPLASVGLYVPGGTAAYPSSVLMNAIPAKVAGVARIAMVVPAPDGVLNPLVLAAAELAGVGEIYRIGGAQAVAALAYGTATIAAGRQDRRARQRLCRRGQAPGLRHGRHRHDRRPVGDPGGGRRATTIPPGSPPICCPRPSTTRRRRRS